MIKRISDADLAEISLWASREISLAKRLAIPLALDLRDSRAEVTRLTGEVERLQGLIENSKEGVK